MSQYTPWGDLSAFPELDRRLRRGEMESCADYMRNLDLARFLSGAHQRPGGVAPLPLTSPGA